MTLLNVQNSSNMEFTMARPFRFLLLELKLSRVELNLKLLYRGNQKSLAFSFISTATLINATKTIKGPTVCYVPGVGAVVLEGEDNFKT